MRAACSLFLGAQHPDCCRHHWGSSGQGLAGCGDPNLSARRVGGPGSLLKELSYTGRGFRVLSLTPIV